MEKYTQRDTTEPRRKCRTRSTEKAKYNKLRKTKQVHTETFEERQARLERDRLRQSRYRLNETPEQRKARLERNRKRKAESILSETPEERKIRQERDRKRKIEARLEIRRLAQASLTEMPEQPTSQISNMDVHVENEFIKGLSDAEHQQNDESLCPEPYIEEQFLKESENMQADPLDFLELTIKEEIKQEILEDCS